MNKLCTGCNRELPATSEYFHKKNGGFATRCKQCIKEYYQRYYNENHERVKNEKVEMSREYYDRNKEEVNSRRRKQYKEGTSAKKRYMERYYLTNKNVIIENRKIYIKSDTGKEKQKIYQQIRRARGMNLEANLTMKEWNKCKIYFENKCAYCGLKTTLTKDHFIPLKNGGEYTINNIIPACKPCNSKKKASDFFEWFPKQDFYTKQREQKILKYLNYKDHMQQLALL